MPWDVAQKAINILDQVAKLDFSCCQDCWLIRICNLCFAHMVCGNEYCIEKWHFSCKMRRKHYTDALQLYCEITEEDEGALDFLAEQTSPIV